MQNCSIFSNTLFFVSSLRGELHANQFKKCSISLKQVSMQPNERTKERKRVKTETTIGFSQTHVHRKAQQWSATNGTIHSHKWFCVGRRSAIQNDSHSGGKWACSFFTSNVPFFSLIFNANSFLFSNLNFFTNFVFSLNCLWCMHRFYLVFIEFFWCGWWWDDRNFVLTFSDNFFAQLYLWNYFQCYTVLGEIG